MISFDEAVDQIRRIARPIGTETVPLAEAAGRVLAAPVRARIDSPRFDVSSMDGYAVRAADLGDLPARLSIVGESRAGERWDGRIGPGECARIFTGAALPDGADGIVIQEHVRRDGAQAIVEQVSASDFIRRRGSDFRSGDVLLDSGQPMSAGALVAAAAADHARVEVFRRPRLAIIATGDELANPGEAADGSQSIPDSASIGVAALAGQWGADVVEAERIGDDLDQLRSAARRALDCADLVLVIGGASAGDRDFAKPMFEPFGLSLHFSKLAIRPGKPAWFGEAGGRLVLGLPGNPTSALVTARLLLAPLICGLTGRNIDDALDWRPAPLAQPLAACGPRETFHRARWDDGKVVLLFNQDSGAQKALAEAELLIRQAAGSPELPAGTTVPTLAF